MALYIMVTSTLQQSNLAGTAMVQGYGLSMGAKRKVSAHAKACRAASISFIPLVVESLGS